MAKLWILAAVFIAALVQVVLTQEVAVALSNDIREPLTENEKILAEDDGSNKEIVIITVSGSKSETIDEVQATPDGATTKFTPQPVTEKLQQDQINDNISRALENNGLNSQTIDERQAVLEDITNTKKLEQYLVSDNINGATENNGLKSETIDERQATLEDTTNTDKLEQDQVNDNINGATEKNGLKSETIDERQAVLEDITNTDKLEQDQVNDNINGATENNGLKSEPNQPAKEDDNTKTAMEFLQSLFNGPSENNGIKAETIDEKPAILEDTSEGITPDFNILEEKQLNRDIKIAREFHQSLLKGAPKFRCEVGRTIATLDSILKEPDLKTKQVKFSSFEKSFSHEFQTFLKNYSAPWLDHNLRMARGFLGYLVGLPHVMFKSEITALKVSADAALAKTSSVDDKKKTLFKIFNPDSQELDAYLKKVSPHVD